MATSFTVRVSQSLADLQQRLAALPNRLRNNIIRGALRAGAAVMRDGARNRAPKRTGALRQSIRVSMREYRPDNPVAHVKAGGKTRRGDVWYAHIIERGAKAHVIKPSVRRALAFDGRARSRVNHPGVRANLFMATTAQADRVAARTAFQAYAVRRVQQFIDRGTLPPGRQ